MLGESRLGEGTISNLPSLWLKIKAKLEISRGDFLIQKGVTTSLVCKFLY